MSRRAPIPWEPFRQCELPGAVLERAKAAGYNLDFLTLWANNRYVVFRHLLRIPDDAVAFAGQVVVHLSIRRQDRNPVRDWRHLQRIKNELVGEECEGVELYPAESRLVDEANQFHLYVLGEPGLRFPWGDPDRKVGGPEAAAEAGGKQRAFDC